MSEDEYIYPDSDSNDGDGYDYGSDASGGGYDYGSDASMQGSDGDGGGMDFEVELTNQYYVAEDHYSERRWTDALDAFMEIIKREKACPEEVKNMNEGPYSFLSMARVVMIQLKLGKTGDEVVRYYKELLTMMDLPSVTANQRERAIDDTLQALAALNSASASHGSADGGAAAAQRDLSTLGMLYELTLRALAKAKNERLWFKTCIAQTKLFLAARDFARVESLIDGLYAKCGASKLDAGGAREPPLPAAAAAAGRGGPTAGGGPGGGGPGSGARAAGAALASAGAEANPSDLMELYAVHVALLYEQKRFGEMKALYPRTKAAAMRSAVEDVRVMGALRELGGRMYMRTGAWKRAYDEFYESFRAYNESGRAAEAVQCLKCLVISNILSDQAVNPFDTREVRAFAGASTEVDAVRDLRLAYQQDDIERFTNILRHPANKIESDPFIGQYLEPIVAAIRRRVAMRLLRPYRRVSLAYLAERLSMGVEEVETLLSQLILDGRVHGSIDQTTSFFHARRGGGKGGAPKAGGAADAASGSAAGNPKGAAAHGASVEERRYAGIREWARRVDALTDALNARIVVV
jgi:COP9 signalosome complex subunit 2